MIIYLSLILYATEIMWCKSDIMTALVSVVDLDLSTSKMYSPVRNRGRDFLPLSTVDVLRVACEPIKQEEDVSAACNSVTNPRSLLQQTFLPHELPTADTCVQILGFLIHQVGFSKQIRHTCMRGLRRERDSRN